MLIQSTTPMFIEGFHPLSIYGDSIRIDLGIRSVSVAGDNLENFFFFVFKFMI